MRKYITNESRKYFNSGIPTNSINSKNEYLLGKKLKIKIKTFFFLISVVCNEMAYYLTFIKYLLSFKIIGR